MELAGNTFWQWKSQSELLPSQKKCNSFSLNLTFNKNAVINFVIKYNLDSKPSYLGPAQTTQSLTRVIND
jgi:hypothetical protein